MKPRSYAFMEAGSVEYSPAEAAVDIDEMIEALVRAKSDGATHVVGKSGNYRGAKYQSLGLPEMTGDNW